MSTVCPSDEPRLLLQKPSLSLARLEETSHPPSNRTRRERSVQGIFAPLAVVLSALLFAAPGARAGGPVEELLRYVPPDVGFCLVARDLRGHGQALADSPFVAGLRKTAAGEALARADELNRIEKLQEQLQSQLGFDWNRLRDDIFGDGLAFAYRAGPPGKPEEEAGLILIRARAPKPLIELVDHINELQKNSGEVSAIEERTHRNTTYFRRVEKNKPASFYCLRGPILLLSANASYPGTALDLEQSRRRPELSRLSPREMRLLKRGPQF